MTNIMEKIIQESDHENIAGALKAFAEYVQCKGFYKKEKEELTDQLHEIDSSIDSSKDRVQQFNISSEAIKIAESLRNRTEIERLFIHYVTSPDFKIEDIAQYKPPVTENQSKVFCVIEKETGIVVCSGTEEECFNYIAESELSEGEPKWTLYQGEKFQVVFVETGEVYGEGTIKECESIWESVTQGYPDMNDEELHKLKLSYRIKRVEHEKNTDNTDTDNADA